MPSLGQFIAARQAHWADLEALLARTQGNGLRRVPPEDLDALGRAYRQAVSDLAIAQRDFPDDELTASLNTLAARAHLRLYRAPGGAWRDLGHFFWDGFARRFRASRGYLLVAAALFFLPGVWAYVAALTDPALRDTLVPPQLTSVMERGRTWTDIEAPLRPAMATVIFTHNLQVSFLAFAGGIFAGLGTVYALVSNGLSIGAVLGAAQFYGVAPLLWAFISPHGYLEITSILIAAAGGLILGDALLRPGLYRRREALAHASRNAVQLVGGAAPVFVVAGLIEGFISPSDLPMPLKLAIGPLTAVALYSLLLTAGRRKPAR